jgi:hypothetical protein
MRYFLHLESETNIYIDHRGKEFPDVASVAAYATGMARELAEHDRWLGWQVRVIDATNAEVFCAPIVDPARAEMNSRMEVGRKRAR